MIGSEPVTVLGRRWTCWLTLCPSGLVVRVRGGQAEHTRIALGMSTSERHE